ncbi:protein LIKE COV 3 isoform X3 [Manihot esculenta]|uniref:protein LIKE COV 3 isoform X3 n=1 Tax=Manihot esculenta TaxID=3983 RepID=UPI000B5D84C1|nr:protein LIKE COV 3 isoform X3 [Manihot esculenta]
METRERDIERLMPIQAIKNRDNNNTGFSNSSSETVSPLVSSSHHSAGREAFCKVIRSWASKKFMTGCVILLPIAITFCVTWWFISFVDGFFSPIYAHLGINVFAVVGSFCS